MTRRHEARRDETRQDETSRGDETRQDERRKCSHLEKEAVLSAPRITKDNERLRERHARRCAVSGRHHDDHAPRAEWRVCSERELELEHTTATAVWGRGADRDDTERIEKLSSVRVACELGGDAERVGGWECLLRARRGEEPQRDRRAATHERILGVASVIKGGRAVHGSGTGVELNPRDHDRRLELISERVELVDNLASSRLVSARHIGRARGQRGPRVRQRLRSPRTHRQEVS